MTIRLKAQVVQKNTAVGYEDLPYSLSEARLQVTRVSVKMVGDIVREGKFVSNFPSSMFELNNLTTEEAETLVPGNTYYLDITPR